MGVTAATVHSAGAMLQLDKLTENVRRTNAETFSTVYDKSEAIYNITFLNLSPENVWCPKQNICSSYFLSHTANTEKRVEWNASCAIQLLYLK